MSKITALRYTDRAAFLDDLYQNFKDIRPSEVFVGEDLETILLRFNLDPNACIILIKIGEWLICDDDGYKVYSNSWVQEFYAEINRSR
jgi:hypothetical protein